VKTVAILSKPISKLTRKQVLEQNAAALFREKGYSASSMRDLAQMMGIEPASLYSHIRSKEELLQNICMPLAQDLFQGLKVIVQQNASAKEKLSKALSAHLEIITRDTNYALVFLNEYRHLSEPFRTEFLSMRKEYEQQFMLILRQGIRSGEFRKIDEKITTLTLLSAINSTPQWYRKESSFTPDALASQLTDILVNGLSEPIVVVSPKTKSS
jgi:AcrR family transcriptional regulator